jgi:hypothetical protein
MTEKRTGGEMKLCTKKAQGILSGGGRLTQPSWGDTQYIKLSDADKFQHFVLRGDKWFFENYALTYFEVFLQEWEVLK